MDELTALIFTGSVETPGYPDDVAKAEAIAAAHGWQTPGAHALEHWVRFPLAAAGVAVFAYREAGLDLAGRTVELPAVGIDETNDQYVAILTEAGLETIW